jgi:LuxR family transcriptional regulator, maltose regulon positive regulatory protein
VRAAWLLEQGEAAQALEAATLAQQAAAAMGPAPLALSLFIAGQALLALGQPAADVAGQLQHIARHDDNPRAAVCAQWLQALQAWQQGNEATAVAGAASALAHVAAAGGGGFFGLHRPSIAPLLAAVLAHENAAAAATAARAAVNTWRVQAPAQAGAHWPWPVRIELREPLRIHVHGLPVALGPKAPLRPLQLLQALIHHGGHAPAAHLADRLWPEAEGDRAMASFEVALRRLRALLVVPEALVLNAGVLVLNRRCVWVGTGGTAQSARQLLHAGEPAD